MHALKTWAQMRELPSFLCGSQNCDRQLHSLLPNQAMEAGQMGIYSLGRPAILLLADWFHWLTLYFGWGFQVQWQSLTPGKPLPEFLFKTGISFLTKFILIPFRLLNVTGSDQAIHFTCQETPQGSPAWSLEFHVGSFSKGLALLTVLKDTLLHLLSDKRSSKWTELSSQARI